MGYSISKPYLGWGESSSFCSHPGWNGSRVANTYMDPHGDRSGWAHKNGEILPLIPCLGPCFSGSPAGLSVQLCSSNACHDPCMKIWQHHVVGGFHSCFLATVFRVRGRKMAKPPVTCSLHMSMAQKWMNLMYGLLFHVIRYGNTWLNQEFQKGMESWTSLSHTQPWLRVFVFFTTLKASSVVSAQCPRPPAPGTGNAVFSRVVKKFAVQADQCGKPPPTWPTSRSVDSDPPNESKRQELIHSIKIKTVAASIFCSIFFGSQKA